MKIKDVIADAGELRASSVAARLQAKWVADFDRRLADLFYLTAPEHTWPEETDPDLIVPEPYDEVYTLYLLCRLDYYNGDLEIYQADMSILTSSMADMQAWWQRHHPPIQSNGWKVF